METIGLVQVSGGAFLIEGDEPNQWLALHWAGRIRGLERAWENDTRRQNKCVQVSVSNGLPHCKTFIKRMPDWAIDFMVYLGNATNKEVLCETFNQVCGCLMHIEMLG